MFGFFAVGQFLHAQEQDYVYPWRRGQWVNEVAQITYPDVTAMLPHGIGLNHLPAMVTVADPLPYFAASAVLWHV